MGQQKEVYTPLDDLDNILDSFAHFGVKLGLESTRILLTHLDNPHHNVPVIHVAGTNGKGSVCSYLSTILHKAGYRVGRYTSPHLVNWTERICLNNDPIPAPSLLDVVRRIKAIVTRHHLEATQFEVITAAAWTYFAAQQVDIAIMEVGLGGRLDSTNVCDRPLASVITSIGMDHWQQLGNTLADIAREKAGILKSECPAIIGPVSPAAQTVIEQRIHALHCSSTWVSPSKDLGNNRFEYFSSIKQPPIPSSPHDKGITGLKYSLSLHGDYQRTNSAIAIATIAALQQQGWTIAPAHIQQGLADTQWPGRLQWLTWHGTKLLVDGAHNAAAAEALRQYTDTLPQPIHWIIGMLESKDHQGVFNALLNQGDHVSLVPVPDSKTAQPMDLATIARACSPHLATCCAYDDVVSILNQHVSTISAQDNVTMTDSGHFAKMEKPSTLVLCGSLYLIGHLLSLKDRLNA